MINRRFALGGYIMLALLTVFLTIVIARLGVLDGPAIWLADWLTANIDGADLSVAAGFSLSLLAYLIVLWFVWSRGKALPPASAGPAASKAPASLGVERQAHPVPDDIVPRCENGSLAANGRQRCRLCGRPDKFNFILPDEVWLAVVPEPYAQGVVCLFCVDALAEMRGVDYAPHLRDLCFAGDKAVFEWRPVRAISL